MESIVLTPSDLNERIYSIGTWLLVSGIINIISPFFLASIAFRNSYLIILALLIPMIAMAAFLFIAIRVLWKHKDIFRDPVFTNGVLIALIGSSIIIAWSAVLFLMLLINVVLHPELLWTEISISLIALLPIGIGALITLLGFIFLGIFMWRFGDINNSGIIQIGSIIQAFLWGIGMVLTGVGLRILSENGRRALAYEKFLDTVKERIATSKPTYEIGVNLKIIANQFNIPTYLLITIANQWIERGELKGKIIRYYFIPEEIQEQE